jgi:hypothetical protein
MTASCPKCCCEHLLSGQMNQDLSFKCMTLLLAAIVPSLFF